jgi:hemoglobin
MADPVLNHPFSHDGHPDHVERLASYWAEVFGGPPAYSRTCGGHSAMLELHARTGAGEDYARRFAACFRRAVEQAGIPVHLRQRMSDYIDVAVQEVEQVSPPDAVVPPDLPMPQWGSR